MYVEAFELFYVLRVPDARLSRNLFQDQFATPKMAPRSWRIPHRDRIRLSVVLSGFSGSAECNSPKLPPSVVSPPLLSW